MIVFVKQSQILTNLIPTKCTKGIFMATNLHDKPFGTSFRIGLVIDDCVVMNMTALTKFGAKPLGSFCAYKLYKHNTCSYISRGLSHI